jgi:hypothetical protein
MILVCLINRGDQDNGIFMWDESVDKFTLGLTTADGTSTGNITLASLGTLVANIEGNVTGDLTGTIQTAAQPNITSVGTLTGLTTTGNIVVTGTVDGRDVATDGTKLDGIEALADVTDVTNVTAAGALMDSELTSIASVKALNQGVASTDSPTFVAVTGTLATAAQPNITSVGTLTGLTTTGDINFGDNDKAIFGAGSDLQIYHDGSHSYIT